MASFGQCNESSCTENAVRLFHCVHHCMKLLCLQHLIEHDRLMNYEQQYLTNMRVDLKQLWLTYSSFIDEAKLHYEFEERLKAHQQLMQDVAALLANNSLNIEQYQSAFEKLEKYIQQEKQLNRHATQSDALIELVKIEPAEELSIIDEANLSNTSFATVTERVSNTMMEKKQDSRAVEFPAININDHLIENSCQTWNNSIVKEHKVTKIYIPMGAISGKCPFWLDGTFGLTQEDHGMYLCQHGKHHRILYRHLIKSHKLIPSIAGRLCRIIHSNEYPREEILFQPNDIVIDQMNNFRCPFSIYQNSSPTIDMTLQNRCRGRKPLRSDYLRYHLIRRHRMTKENAKNIVQKLKINS